MLTISACEGGSVKRTLGLKKHTPDEFMVMSRPPLAVPPDFSLQPPSETDIRSQSQVRDEAKKVLFSGAKTESKSSANVSKGERSLLNQAGAGESTSNIRTILDSEYREAYDAPVEEKGMLEKLVEPLTPEKKDPLVDIDKEEERLTKNKEEGKPVNEGDVPVKDSKTKGVVNELFGL
jgi:hypothetical protein